MARRHGTYAREGCAVEAALEIIGAKWKGGIVYHLLLNSELRFSELQRRMPGVTQRILAKALRELESDGVLLRTVYPTVPPQVGYRLTPEGEALRPAMMALHQWGRARRPSFEAAAE